MSVVVSGGFDPIHIGHLRMFNEAKALASEFTGKLIVIVNNDEFLLEKKGYVFMPWDERAELISALACVDNVIQANDDDRTVCETLKELRPDIFANGGDRGVNTTPEAKLCEELDIELMWNIGGGKVRSSSNLVREISMKKSKLDRKRFREELAI